jgi:hypothetical protein
VQRRVHGLHAPAPTAARPATRSPGADPRTPPPDSCPARRYRRPLRSRPRCPAGARPDSPVTD